MSRWMHGGAAASLVALLAACTSAPDVKGQNSAASLTIGGDAGNGSTSDAATTAADGATVANDGLATADGGAGADATSGGPDTTVGSPDTSTASPDTGAGSPDTGTPDTGAVSPDAGVNAGGHWCDSHCTNAKQPSGCYCDTQCVQFGDCCNADGSAPTKSKPTKSCAGSTCQACSGTGGGTGGSAVCGNGVCEAGETTVSCAKDCPSSGGGGGSCTTYADVQSIFKTKCSGCHNFGGGCSMASKYTKINFEVQSGAMPPKGGLSAEDKAKIAAWAAAKNACTTAQCP